MNQKYSTNEWLSGHNDFNGGAKYTGVTDQNVSHITLAPPIGGFMHVSIYVEVSEF